MDKAKHIHKNGDNSPQGSFMARARIVVAVALFLVSASAWAQSKRIVLESEPNEPMLRGQGYTVETGIITRGGFEPGREAALGWGTGFGPRSGSISIRSSTGQVLRPGAYDFAGIGETSPGEIALVVRLEGYACGSARGTLRIDSLEFGPLGYVQSLHGSFEQRCSPAAGLLRGRFDIENVPPPTPMTIALLLEPKSYLDKPNRQLLAIAEITCSRAGTYFIDTDAVQRVPEIAVAASGPSSGPCGPESRRMGITMEPDEAFRATRAMLEGHAAVIDPVAEVVVHVRTTVEGPVLPIGAYYK